MPSLAAPRRRTWTITAADVRPLRLSLTLLLLAVLPYVNALEAGFTLDDEPQIWTNPAVTQGVAKPPLLPPIVTVLCVIVALVTVAFPGVHAPPPLPLREVLLMNWVLVI